MSTMETYTVLGNSLAVYQFSCNSQERECDDNAETGLKPVRFGARASRVSVHTLSLKIANAR
jgi:hypothetical protein